MDAMMEKFNIQDPTLAEFVLKQLHLDALANAEKFKPRLNLANLKMLESTFEHPEKEAPENFGEKKDSSNIEEIEKAFPFLAMRN